MGYNSGRTGASVVASLGKADSSVQSVKINGQTKTPDASGQVDLGEIGGGGAMPLNIISGLPYDATVAPNTAVLAAVWMGSFDVSLTAPTDTSIMNTYVVALADLGGGTLSFDKDIKWVNDDAPVFEGNGTLLEMCITYYHGNYVGVWGRSSGSYGDL